MVMKRGAGLQEPHSAATQLPPERKGRGPGFCRLYGSLGAICRALTAVAPAVSPPSGCSPPVPQVRLSGRPAAPPVTLQSPSLHLMQMVTQNARLNLGDTRSHCGPRATSSWVPCTCSAAPPPNCQTEQSPHTVLGAGTQ